ncbi:MAG: hypothetical protein KA354_08350 [Phycisphaerae bacterium]|nr:hypothetical protein [Phycisphaerae bacterium]
MNLRTLAKGTLAAGHLHVLVGTVFALAAAGCGGVTADKYQATQRQLQLSQERIRQLEYQLASEQEGLRTLQAQIARLRGLDRKAAMEQLVAPVKIDFASMSGGYDTDNKPGDDGIVLYVQPYDEDGHVIKAAGSIQVVLLDPLSPADQNVVGEYRFDVPTTRKMWYGRLMTHHFSIRCPWPSGKPPVHAELIAHTAFFDLLTGRTLTAQKAIKILLPPELPTSTAPQP